MKKINEKEIKKELKKLFKNFNIDGLVDIIRGKEIFNFYIFLKDLKNNIEEYINLNDKFEGSFFWDPPRKAADRRRLEDENYIEYENKEYTNIIKIKFKFELYVSCNNFYVDKYVYINEKKTNLRKIRSILKETKLLIEFFEYIFAEIKYNELDKEISSLIDILNIDKKNSYKINVI